MSVLECTETLMGAHVLREAWHTWRIDNDIALQGPCPMELPHPT